MSTTFRALLAILLVGSILGCKNGTSTSEDPRPSVNINPNDTIQSPFELHINSEGIWSAYEGELGTVNVLNAKGENIATGIMRSADGNWMTTEPAPFVAGLEFNIEEGQAGTLVFHDNFVTEEGGNKPKAFEIPVYLSPSKAMAQTNGRKWCFAEKTQSHLGEGDNHNYQFVQMMVKPNNQVVGWRISAPYGTDGSVANLQGKYDAASKSIQLQSRSYGEGMYYDQEETYGVTASGLELGYTNPDGTPAILTKQSCENFDSMLNDYRKSVLQNTINQTDRSRLIQNKELRDLGYSSEDLKNMRFMERAVDLDNNYQTQEYLLYIMDPMLCGTGGCSLYIVNEKGETLSYMTVTKLPVYTTNLSVEQQQAKGMWKDLAVWSNGSFRSIQHDGESYPMNPSTETSLDTETIQLHPEKYRLLMDYLD